MDAQTTAAPAAPAPQDTPSWLAEHCPRAVRWHRLWLADRDALILAMKIAGSMPASASRADSLLLEHAATERSSSLGYIAELIIVDDHARLALEAHDVRASMVERLQARRARLAELIAEVQRATERMTKSLRLLRLALELTP